MWLPLYLTSAWIGRGSCTCIIQFFKCPGVNPGIPQTFDAISMIANASAASRGFRGHATWKLFPISPSKIPRPAFLTVE